jgi:hypothetical protein
MPVPLGFIAQHAAGLGHDRVRNVDTNASRPRVAEDQGCRAAEMQRPDRDAGIERGADPLSGLAQWPRRSARESAINRWMSDSLMSRVFACSAP